MNRFVLVALPLLAIGCHSQANDGDAVRSNYENSADAIDAQAEALPEPTAKKIYHARAEALREEGRDRETGLEGGDPSSGPSSGPNSGPNPAGNVSH